jgi:hypothetical protein
VLGASAEIEQHLVLPDADRAAELSEDGSGRIVLRQVEDADLPERPKRPQERLGIAGELEELDMLARLPVDRG